MAEITLQVSEKMAKFIEWARSKGQEELTRMIHERLAELKEWDAQNHGMRDLSGAKWDQILEPSDSPEQWKQGGDCNRCRRLSYCLKKCRANKTLKKITTPFLYEQYMAEVPEAAAQAVAGMTPEQVLDMMGIEHGSVVQ